jgi:hypothetical protein
MRYALLLFLAAAACSPYSPDLGAAPFFCGSGTPQQQCPDGYTCMSTGSAGVCTKMGGSGVPVDGTPSGCNDDSTLEPNDSITMAWQTPVDTRKNFPLSSLAICPAGDKDTFAMMVTVEGENIEALIDYSTTGADLQAGILNATGNTVAQAMPITGAPGHIRAYLANANVNTYYIQVFGPVSGPSTNNYNLTINITGP